MLNIEDNANKYIYHPKVKEFYEIFKSIDKEDYPSVNYFGINFNENDIASFKFYFTFFKRLNENEILKFLPCSSDFLKYYHLWELSPVKSYNHNGCTFELKFKGNMEPVYGFHYKIKPIPEAFEIIGYPKLLPFDISSLTTYPGINYEYSKNKTLRKIYYYFYESEHKNYFAKRFGHPFIEDCYIIEYTEADEFSKIIAWRPDHTPENLNRPNIFSAYANEVINYIRNKYGLYNLIDGLYEKNNLRSTYFLINNIKESNEDPYSHPLNQSFDTLSLFYGA